MEQDPEMKAGPFELNIQPEHRRNNSSDLRRYLRYVVAVTFFVAVSLCFYDWDIGSVHIRTGFWHWRQGNYENKGHEQDGGSKGSQYLLGVGKADITGYEYFF